MKPIMKSSSPTSPWRRWLQVLSLLPLTFTFIFPNIILFWFRILFVDLLLRGHTHCCSTAAHTHRHTLPYIIPSQLLTRPSPLLPDPPACCQQLSKVSWFPFLSLWGNSWPEQLKGGRFALAHSLRIPPPPQWGSRGSRSMKDLVMLPPQSGSKEKNALCSAPFLPVSSPGLQPGEWRHPHLG